MAVSSSFQLEITDQATDYAYTSDKHPLVSKLWAVRGSCDETRVKRIAKRSNLPLKWLDAMPSINGAKGMKKLQSERGVLLLRNRTSSFVDQFQHPIGRCSKFYNLTAYNNCNFWCEYCYLFPTFRTMPISAHFVNYEKMFKEIGNFDKSKNPDVLRVLNLGELCDPLAIEDITGFVEELIPCVARETEKTRLMFLTKSNRTDSLLDLDHKNRAIMAFSVNTDMVCRQLEHRTASPEERLRAAQRLLDAGYEIRLRIDPVILYSSWKKDYVDLVNKIFSFIKPERITIGGIGPQMGLLLISAPDFLIPLCLRYIPGLLKMEQNCDTLTSTAWPCLK